MKLKANSAGEYTRIIENDVIPLLRRQPGFRDEIACVAPERSEAVGISFWDNKADAEAYSRNHYPDVLKALSGAIEGTPRVETFEVSNSSFHKIAAKGA
jgi:hypothetical protein